LACIVRIQQIVALFSPLRFRASGTICSDVFIAGSLNVKRYDME
jgi:hypothetical protein